MSGIPTTQKIADDNLARFEGQLGQTSPLNSKAFLRVLSVVEAFLGTSFYKYGLDRVKQALATTASEEGLDVLADGYGVIRKVAVATGLTISVPGTNGTIIPQTVDFVGDANGIRYRVDAPATVAGGFATVAITAKEAGAVGNLNNGDTLSIGTQVPGAGTTGEVTATTTVGADEESLEAYRQRIKDREQAPGGGGNSADYRNWAQETGGVARAFPFAGNPVTLAAQDNPPERTVYIEATTAVDPDGIPPGALLDSVRVALTTDPITGRDRQGLGDTDETLFVEPIIRTAFFVQISGLTVDPAVEVSVKQSIEDQLTAYFLTVRPHVGGLDPVIEKNDIITELSLSNVVQDVLGGAGATAQSIQFNVGTGVLVEYPLDRNEKAKLSPGGITYV